MAMEVTGVTTDEKLLAELEAVVADGMQTFVKVGTALLRIRDERLYKIRGYSNFATYCQEHLHFQYRRYADRLIEAAYVARAIGVGEAAELGPIGPTSEAQARELAPLAREDPDAAREVWGEITADEERPTAVRIRQAVAERYPRFAPTPKPGSKPPTQVNVIHFGQVLEWQPREMAAALPEDQIDGQIAEAKAAQRWLSTYIRELSARRGEERVPEQC